MIMIIRTPRFMAFGECIKFMAAVTSPLLNGSFEENNKTFNVGPTLLQITNDNKRRLQQIVASSKSKYICLVKSLSIISCLK